MRNAEEFPMSARHSAIAVATLTGLPSIAARNMAVEVPD
jgi:hypothetical protein